MIYAWTGRVGAGKTYGMVEYAWHSHRTKGRQVFSNFFVDFATEFEDWTQLTTLHNALVLIDELSLWAAARDWQKLPYDVTSWLAQSRKDGVHLLYTAQSFAGVDAVIRRLTAQVHQCTRFGPLVRVETIDPTSGERLSRRFKALRPEVWQHYDTLEVVSNAQGAGGRLGWAAIANAAREAEAAAGNAFARLNGHEHGRVTYLRATLELILDGAELTTPTPTLDRAREAGQIEDVRAEIARVAQLRQSRATQKEPALCPRSRTLIIHRPRNHR